jgi:hypothetical protein|uniref:Uncharacterized protein n=1 Tax=candidate division WOR-3 bacterium TaxID=2052148 RepID=A0A7V3VTH4_UNCW3
MMDEILNKIEERGLGLPFVVRKDGDTFTSKMGEVEKAKFSQTGTIIFETIGAVGSVKIDTLEINGKNQILFCDIADEDLVGIIYATSQSPILENILNALKDIRARQRPQVVEEKKTRAKFTPEFLEELKSTVREYLGDFTERVFQNQLKAQRIKVDELYEDEVRRFIFALGKAAGMIIGPTKGKDLTNKLLAKLK